MARGINRLSVKECEAEPLKKRRLADGGGLYLLQARGGSKSWVFMWSELREFVEDGKTVKRQKRWELGLGGYTNVKLKRARELAQEQRDILAQGLNPIRERNKSVDRPFGDVALEFIERNKSQWTNSKHADQWRSTLETYCRPIWNRHVNEIDVDAVLYILTPIWDEKRETATRVRGRMERVLDYASTRGWREGENPARWRGHLKNVLPGKPKGEANHFAALSYEEVPAFVASLQERPAVSARALEFTILTLVRTSEALKAQWSEIDFENALWVIPAERMKAKRSHRVPLSGRCIEILNSLLETRDSDFVFPGSKRGEPLSNMSMLMLLRRMKVKEATVHGFRSSFRDWAGDQTTFPREVAEQCLAHAVGSAVEQAYRRSDALERRRKLMEAWTDYCLSRSSDNVISLVQ